MAGQPIVPKQHEPRLRDDNIRKNDRSQRQQRHDALARKIVASHDISQGSPQYQRSDRGNYAQFDGIPERLDVARGRKKSFEALQAQSAGFRIHRTLMEQRRKRPYDEGHELKQTEQRRNEPGRAQVFCEWVTHGLAHASTRRHSALKLTKTGALGLSWGSAAAGTSTLTVWPSASRNAYVAL